VLFCEGILLKRSANPTRAFLSEESEFVSDLQLFAKQSPYHDLETWHLSCGAKISTQSSLWNNHEILSLKRQSRFVTFALLLEIGYISGHLSHAIAPYHKIDLVVQPRAKRFAVFLRLVAFFDLTPTTVHNCTWNELDHGRLKSNIGPKRSSEAVCIQV